MDAVLALLESLINQAASLDNKLSPEEQKYTLEVFSRAIEYISSKKEVLPEKPKQLPSAEFPSSNINGFLYDPDTQKLLVQFHGPYPKAAGSIYSYDGVPKYLFDILSAGGVGPKTSGQNRYHRWIKGVTPSLGGSVNAILKAGGFPYQRLSG